MPLISKHLSVTYSKLQCKYHYCIIATTNLVTSFRDLCNQNLYCQMSPMRQCKQKLSSYFKPKIGTKATIKQNRQRMASGDNDTKVESEGLGSLPKHLPSVSSLLLFNTSENPYR